MRQKNYLHRTMEDKLNQLLRSFGAIEVCGPKWCGKTWIARNLCESQILLDDKTSLDIAEIDPQLALQGSCPRLIDEWQLVPSLWDAVRRNVDANSQNLGKFILTGSSNITRAQEKQIHHSGTGRISKLKLLPMTLSECGFGKPLISLTRLFNQQNFEGFEYTTSIQEIAEWCCRGGWPATVKMNLQDALMVPTSYIESIINADAPKSSKSPQTAQALAKALAINTNRSVKIETIQNDMSSFLSTVSTKTIVEYIDFFERLYLIDRITGWTPPLRSKSRVRVKPKFLFCDPSIPCALLNATPQKLLGDMQTLGDVFESLVLRDLLVFVNSYDGFGSRLSYYRDNKGLEVDAIIEKDNKWAGIEVKLSESKIDEAAHNLLRLNKLVTLNEASKNNHAAFLAVVVGKSSYAYRRTDGVYVLPAACLMP